MKYRTRFYYDSASDPDLCYRIEKKRLWYFRWKCLAEFDNPIDAKDKIEELERKKRFWDLVL